jgi:hypothetical protein
MQKLLEMLAQRASILLIIGGALIIIVGAANGFTINNFSIAFPDLWGRYIVLAVGAVLIAFGFYLEKRDPRQTGVSGVSGSRGQNAGSITFEYLETPTRITHTRHNRLKINSGFLDWVQCSIMLWVLVPPKEEGLRLTKGRSRYILAHQLGGWDRGKNEWRNLFSLRYRGTGDSTIWEVAISNDIARRLAPRMSLPDRLTPGWHLFLIRWDSSKPEISFWIDGDAGGNVISQKFQDTWPKKLTNVVTVGAFSEADIEYENSYCETAMPFSDNQ